MGSKNQIGFSLEFHFALRISVFLMVLGPNRMLEVVCILRNVFTTI